MDIYGISKGTLSNYWRRRRRRREEKSERISEVLIQFEREKQKNLGKRQYYIFSTIYT